MCLSIIVLIVTNAAMIFLADDCFFLMGRFVIDIIWDFCGNLFLILIYQCRKKPKNAPYLWWYHNKLMHFFTRAHRFLQSLNSIMIFLFLRLRLFFNYSWVTQGVNTPEDHRNFKSLIICYFIIETKQKQNRKINVSLSVFQTTYRESHTCFAF